MHRLLCDVNTTGDFNPPGYKRQVVSSGINDYICEMTHEGKRYKQPNDLITSYGSSAVIAAYGENHSDGSCQIVSRRGLLGPVVGG